MVTPNINPQGTGIVVLRPGQDSPFKGPPLQLPQIQPPPAISADVKPLEFNITRPNLTPPTPAAPAPEPEPSPGLYVDSSIVNPTDAAPLPPVEPAAAPQPEPVTTPTPDPDLEFPDEGRNLLARLGAGVANVPLFPATLLGLGQKAVGAIGDQFDTDLHPSPDYDVLKHVDDILQTVRQTIKPGMEPPHGFIENAEEALGSALVPIGGLTKLPMGVGTAAKYLAPGTNVMTPANVAINTAIPAAISTGIESLIGPADAQPAQPGLYVDKQLGNQVPANPMAVPGPTWTQRHGGELVYGAFAAAAALAGAAGIRRMVQAPKPGIGQVVPGQIGSVRGVASALGQYTLDSEGPAMGFVNRFGDKNTNAGGKFEDLLTTTTRSTGRAGAIEALKTGRMPGGSTVRMPSYARMRIDYNMLSPQQQELFDKGILAQTLLDTRVRAKAGDIPDRMINPQTKQIYTNHELTQIIQQLWADPKLGALANQYKNMTHAALEYMQEQGVISNAKRLEMLRDNPNYAPINQLDKKDGFLATLANQFTKLSTEGRMYADTESLIRRDLTQGGGAENAIKAMDSLEYYMESAIVSSQRNAVIREFFNQTAQAIKNGRFDNSQETFKFLQQSQKAGGNIITFHDRGLLRSVQVNDNAIAAALRFDPYKVHKVMNETRKAMQAGITGILRPAFAPVAMIHGATTFMIQRKPGQGIGYIDKAIQALTNHLFHQKIGLPGDPSAILGAIEGATRGLSGEMKYDLSMRFYKFAQTALGQYVPGLGAGAKQLSDNLMKSYLDSTLHSANRMGGVKTSVGFEQTADGYRSALRDMVANSNQNGYGIVATYRWYKYILESIHNGARLQNVANSEWMKAFKTNAAFNQRPPVTVTEGLRNAVAEGRRVPGDFSRKGGGAATAAATSAEPYLNVAAQAMKSFLQLAKRRKGTTAAGIGIGLMLPRAMELYQVSTFPASERWKYYNEISPDQQAKSIKYWLPGETNILNYREIPIVPHFQPFSAVALDMFNYIYGDVLHSWEGKGTRGGGLPPDVWKSALSRVFDAPLPPVVGEAVALNNRNNPNPLATGSVGDLWRSIHRAPSNGYEGDQQNDYASSIAGWQEDMLTSVLATFGQSLIDAEHEGKIDVQTGKSSTGLGAAMTSLLEDQKRILPGMKPADSRVSAWNDKRVYVEQAMANVKQILGEDLLAQHGGAPSPVATNRPQPLITVPTTQDPQFVNAMGNLQMQSGALRQFQQQLTWYKDQERQARSLPVVRIDREKKIADSREHQSLIYEQMLGEVQRIEKQLSAAVYQGQPVDLRSLAPSDQRTQH